MGMRTPTICNYFDYNIRQYCDEANLTSTELKTYNEYEFFSDSEIRDNLLMN